MVAQPPNTAARQESAPQPSGQGPTPTACVQVKELLERQDDDDTTRITITQTLPRTLSTRTATVTLHGEIPTEPPPRSSEGVSNQQLGAIIGGTCATIVTLLLLGCWILRRRRKNKTSVKSPRGGNPPFPSAPLRPTPWSPRSSTGPGGRQRSRRPSMNTSPSSSGEDFLDDKYSPPPPDSGPQRPPPTYSRPPPDPVHTEASPASENPKSPASSNPGHIPHPPTAPDSSKYPPKFVPTAGKQRPSTNYSASWAPPSIDRSGAYPVQHQSDFALPSSSRPLSTFQSGPFKSGVTAMPRDGPLKAGTAPTPGPSVSISTPPSPHSHRPKIITADPGRISTSSSKPKHAPGSPGHGRTGMISSIGNTPRATPSLRQPPTPVLPAPFSGLHGEKKTVKFPDILEESIPELPVDSDLSPEHAKGNKKSSPSPPSPRQNHHSNGGGESTSPELQDEDQPELSGLEIPEDPAALTPKSMVADEANGQKSFPVESPSGLKSPASGSQSRAPSPEIIDVNQEPPLEGFNEPVPRTPTSPQTAPMTYSSYWHVQSSPAPPTTTYRRAPPLPSDSYYYGHDHIPHHPPPAPPSSHAAEVYRTEHAELPQAKPVRAAGREGRQKNKNKNKTKTKILIKTKALVYFSMREGDKDNRKRSPTRR